MKKLFVLILVLVIAISAGGCGSSKSETSAFAQTSAAEKNDDAGLANIGRKGEAVNNGITGTSGKLEKEAASEIKNDSAQSKYLINNVNVNQKFIFTGQVNMETLNFEKTRTNLCDYINNIGGFAQNSSFKGGRLGYEGLRSAEYVFRIPKPKFNEAFVDLRKFGTIVSEQSNGEDVTNQYFDTEARLKSLKIQQERLEALLKKAEKMGDIIDLEKELQSTIYEIENCTGSLKKWDSLVEYSTLTVRINEVEQIRKETPKEESGLFSRIAFSFKNSALGLWEFVKDAIVCIAAAVPVMIPIVLIGYVAYRIAKKRIKKQKANNSDKEQKE